MTPTEFLNGLFERFSRPLFSSYIISWALVNYRFIMVVVGEGKYADKIDYIEGHFFASQAAVVDSFAVPFVLSFGYVVVGPYIESFVLALNELAAKFRVWIVFKAKGIELVPRKDLEQWQANQEQKTRAAENDGRMHRDRLEGKLGDLNSQVSDLRNRLQRQGIRLLSRQPLSDPDLAQNILLGNSSDVFDTERVNIPALVALINITIFDQLRRFFELAMQRFDSPPAPGHQIVVIDDHVIREAFPDWDVRDASELLVSIGFLEKVMRRGQQGTIEYSYSFHAPFGMNNPKQRLENLASFRQQLIDGKVSAEVKAAIGTSLDDAIAMHRSLLREDSMRSGDA